MNSRIQIGVGIVLGIALIGSVVVFPVGFEYVLYTSPEFLPAENGSANETSIESIGWHQVVAYENLSERGKAAYREALRSEDGRHVMEPNEAPPDFSFEKPGETREEVSIIIERPRNDSDLPPANEPENAQRFENIGAKARKPPYTDPEWYPRYLALVLGVGSFAYSGYLAFRTR